MRPNLWRQLAVLLNTTTTWLSHHKCCKIGVGEAAWEALDKIPRQEWMAYLVWYRCVVKKKGDEGALEGWSRAVLYMCGSQQC